MTYVSRKYPIFNQQLRCGVWLYSAWQGHVNACALARWTYSIFRAYGIPCGSSLLSVTRYSIGYQLFYSFHKRFLCAPIIDKHIASFAPTAFPTLVLFQQRLLNQMADVYRSSLLLFPGTQVAGYLIGYKVLLLFLKNDSDIHGLFLFYLGGNKLHTIPKRSLLFFNCYYINLHHTIHPMPIKSLTQQEVFTFSFANAPAGSYRWNISALAFLCIRSYGGKSSTCD